MLSVVYFLELTPAPFVSNGQSARARRLGSGAADVLRLASSLESALHPRTVAINGEEITMVLTLLLRFGNRSLVCVFAAILQLVTCASTTQAGDELQKLALPLESSEGNVAAAKEALLAILSPIVPTKTSKVTITQDGRYILSGDLFGAGTLYALATLNIRQPAEGEDASIGVGFAAWTGKQWEIRGLWQIAPVWEQRDLKEEDYFPIRPSKVPFWLQDLGGDRTPEVVIVGAVWRYWQEHYVLKLTGKETLRLVADAMGKPAAAAGMLRLHFNSGRRAVFSREEFFRWVGDALVPVATFHNETPYNDPESPFVRITKYDEKGTGGKRWRISLDDTDASAIQYSVFSESLDADSDGLPEVKDGVKPTPSAKVSFIWPEDPSKHAAADSSSVENRYFWERLSGLPWSALPSEPDRPPTPRLPKGVRVKVSGDPELVRRLSTGFLDRIAPTFARPGRRENP